MRSLLIGGSGFLGKSILESIAFSETLTASSPMEQGEYDLVVCAAPSGKKWLANREPESDLAAVKMLIQRIDLLEARRFVLLSTVDVYENVSNSTEESSRVLQSNPYGFHRSLVEDFVLGKFENSLVLRLGGLVGPNLVKNPLYDLRHGNEIFKLNADSQMQFTPVDAIFSYISNYENDWRRIVNLTAPPIRLGELARYVGLTLKRDAPRISYDVKTIWVNDARFRYIVSLEESLAAIRSYLQP